MCGKWNGVLHFLVGSTESGFDEPAEEVQRFLKDTGLMGDPKGMEKKWGGAGDGEEDEDDEEGQQGGNGQKPLRITNTGVDFLLQDVHVQVRGQRRRGLYGYDDDQALCLLGRVIIIAVSFRCGGLLSTSSHTKKLLAMRS